MSLEQEQRAKKKLFPFKYETENVKFISRFGISRFTKEYPRQNLSRVGFYIIRVLRERVLEALAIFPGSDGQAF